MQVPVYDGPQVGVDVRPDGQVRGGAPDTSGLSQGLEAVRNSYLQVAAQEAAHADEIAVQSAETQLSKWINDRLFNPETGDLTKKGKSAFGLAPTTLTEYDKAAGQISSTLTNERQQEAFAKIMSNGRLTMDEALNKHETAERSQYYSDETQATVLDSVKSAGNFFNDPRQIRYQIARQEQALSGQAQREGWSSEKLDASLRAAESNTHLEVLDRMLALRQAGAARNYLNQVRDRMLGDDVTTVERALQTDDATLKMQLRDQLADVEAAAKIGKATSIPSRDLLVSAYGEYEGNRLHQQAQAWLGLSSEVNKLESKSASELVQTMGEYEPQQQKGAASQAERSAFIDSSIRDILKTRENDPATYMISTNPQVQAAWQALSNGEEGAADRYMQVSQAVRDQLQIQNSDPLPKGYADQLVADIIKPKDNETLYATINREAERWGNHWPEIYAQLAPKLPDTAAVIGSGLSPQTGIALSAMSGLKDNELKALVPQNRTWGDVTDAVRSKFRGMLRSFPPDAGGTRTAEAIVDSAIRLALYNVKMGAKLDSAIDSAYKQLVSDHYTVGEFRGVGWRAPAGLDAEGVELGAREVIDTIDLGPSDVSGVGSNLPAELLSDVSNEYVRQNGYWMTNPQGTGLRFFVDGAPLTQNRPVTHDGLPARKNEDGTISTELSITVESEDLNGGKPTNIPSLWGGRELSEEEAIAKAVESGKNYQSFNTVGEAVAAAKARSAAGGANSYQSGMVEYSWAELIELGEKRKQDIAKFMAEEERKHPNY